MSIHGPGEMTSTVSQGRPENGFLGLLRAAALIAVVAGAGGSVGLMLRAGQRTPRLLLVLFVIWVLMAADCNSCPDRRVDITQAVTSK